jgi:hypothetical protein
MWKKTNMGRNNEIQIIYYCKIDCCRPNQIIPEKKYSAHNAIFE